MTPKLLSVVLTDIASMDPMDNLTVNSSPDPGYHSNDDFLFTTLHNYHVTTFSLCINLVTAMLGIWITCLNGLLIETLIKRHAQLDITDSFIHSLAFTDAFLGLLLLYNSTYNVLNFQNRYECLIRFGVLQGMLISSTGHLTLLTINRYIKITRPYNYRKIFTKSRIIILSASVWCFAVCFGLLPLLGWNNDYGPQSNDNGNVACRYFGIMARDYITLNVSLYWIPLVIMVVVYTHVCKISCNHTREITAQRHNVQGRQLSRKDLDNLSQGRSWRFTKTIFTIVGVYFFCWLPAGIFFLLHLIGSLDNVNETWQGDILTVTSSLGLLNSLFNPIIYAAKIPCVKDRFRRLFCCQGNHRVGGAASRTGNGSTAYSAASAVQLKMAVEKELHNISASCHI